MKNTIPDNITIEQNITLEELEKMDIEMIYYAVHTCWWTHLPKHTNHGLSLPTDPRGSVLFQADNPKAFFDAAKNKPEHYGKHGLDAFMSAHSMNCNTSFSNWDSYNELLDKNNPFADK